MKKLALFFTFFSGVLGSDVVDEKKNLCVQDGKICKIAVNIKDWCEFRDDVFIY